MPHRSRTGRQTQLNGVGKGCVCCRAFCAGRRGKPGGKGAASTDCPALIRKMNKMEPCVPTLFVRFARLHMANSVCYNDPVTRSGTQSGKPTLRVFVNHEVSYC